METTNVLLFLILIVLLGGGAALTGLFHVALWIGGIALAIFISWRLLAGGAFLAKKIFSVISNDKMIFIRPFVEMTVYFTKLPFKKSRSIINEWVLSEDNIIMKIWVGIIIFPVIIVMFAAWALVYVVVALTFYGAIKSAIL